ncbi:MAG: uracil-DNA glycosylase [Micavibrio sp.]
MVNGEYAALKAALEWHLDAGADFPLSDVADGLINTLDSPPERVGESVKYATVPLAPQQVPLGASEARADSLKLAMAAKTLDELRTAIAGFGGIGLKDTATSLVFSDGNPAAPIMLVGDAPGAEDDRLGKAFAGIPGQLLDQILKAVGLSRIAGDAQHAIYISHILNWRPPGGRSPAPAELEVSLPFIERHIQLVKPKILILAGGVAAKTLLGQGDPISKLRGKWHSYLPQTPELRDGTLPVETLAIFDPAYLIQNPAQKRLLWGDMLLLLEKRRGLNLID